jgi:hypothetical protein
MEVICSQYRIVILAQGSTKAGKRSAETLVACASLAQSLQKQKRARLIIRAWRQVYIVLACLVLLLILFHGVMELLINVLHNMRPI